MKPINELLAAELGEKTAHIDNVIALLDEGRKRKEEVDG